MYATHTSLATYTHIEARTPHTYTTFPNSELIRARKNVKKCRCFCIFQFSFIGANFGHGRFQAVCVSRIHGFHT